jgi:hypothetical protein
VEDSGGSSSGGGGAWSGMWFHWVCVSDRVMQWLLCLFSQHSHTHTHAHTTQSSVLTMPENRRRFGRIDVINPQLDLLRWRECGRESG